MSLIIEQTVRGAIKIDKVPERACFKTWEEFLRSLPDLLAVEIPVSFGNVIIGNTQPSEDDKLKLWLRVTAQGQYLGKYLFQNGAWEVAHDYDFDDIIWRSGNSANIRSGFQLIEVGDDRLTSDVVSAIRAQFVPNGGGGYSYFAVRYVGY